MDKPSKINGEWSGNMSATSSPYSSGKAGQSDIEWSAEPGHCKNLGHARDPQLCMRIYM